MFSLLCIAGVSVTQCLGLECRIDTRNLPQIQLNVAVFHLTAKARLLLAAQLPICQQLVNTLIQHVIL